MLERDQVRPEGRAIYDALLKQRGIVPNMFKTAANIPALTGGQCGISETDRGRWRAARRVQGSDRGLFRLKKGAGTEHLNGVQDFEQGPFTEAQKIGFRYADRLHRSPAEIDDQFYAAVKSVYNDLQINELTAVAAAFEFFPRFIDALRIPITPPPTQSAQLSEVAGELRVRGQKESL
jgi:hypothetical protein